MPIGQCGTNKDICYNIMLYVFKENAKIELVVVYLTTNEYHLGYLLSEKTRGGRKQEERVIQNRLFRLDQWQIYGGKSPPPLYKLERFFLDISIIHY